MSRYAMSARARAEALTAHDPLRPHCGRVHDYLLGAGKDSYEVDQLLGARLVKEAPAFQLGARAARMFLLRAVHDLAAEFGIFQFVELGAGYPCAPNLHEIAGRVLPGARTVYVDSDAVVAAHGRALLAGSCAEFVHADLTDTDTIVREISATVDLIEPVAICLGFVAEFIADPRAVIDAVTAILPPGSYVVMSHITDDVETKMVHEARDIYRHGGIALWPRSAEEIAGLVSGFDLIRPGLVPVHRWRPNVERAGVAGAGFGWDPAVSEFCLAAVGRLR
ncbi:SAM-dependent methyltransferase (plasmid) [Nocardia sp. NBC_01377]|uniref:SAM-dependent methyltransferase n=1 Tax=Nocardia sp. NBC_01377 TaxID=2903595 RepID=UPI003253E605